METREQYPSDVTDEQWRILVKLLPCPCRRGRKPIDRRRVLNAILYVVRSGWSDNAGHGRTPPRNETLFEQVLFLRIGARASRRWTY